MIVSYRNQCLCHRLRLIVLKTILMERVLGERLAVGSDHCFARDCRKRSDVGGRPSGTQLIAPMAKTSASCRSATVVEAASAGAAPVVLQQDGEMLLLRRKYAIALPLLSEEHAGDLAPQLIVVAPFNK